MAKSQNQLQHIWCVMQPAVPAPCCRRPASCMCTSKHTTAQDALRVSGLSSEVPRTVWIAIAVVFLC